MKLTLVINNKKKSFDVPLNQTLMELLRSQGFWSVKHGCETGNCGNCTITVDGQAVYSCLMLAAQANGKTIETFENIQDRKDFDYLKQAMMDFGDIECDYCLPGMIMSTKALLDTKPEATEDDIVEALTGNVCRCANNELPIEAIMEAIRKMRGRW
ncbi:MAG: (2Fe-2S)-binding protein [bacterium]